MNAQECFEALCEEIATARTLFLMGQHQEARERFQRARMDYLKYRHVLRETAGHLALEHAIEATTEMIEGQP